MCTRFFIKGHNINNSAYSCMTNNFRCTFFRYLLVLQKDFNKIYIN